LAVEDLKTCATNATAPLGQLYADIKNLGDQSAQLVRDIPSDFANCKSKSVLQLLEQLNCYAELGNTDLSKGLLLISSLAYDVSLYRTELKEASEKIIKCGTDEVEEAVKKYGVIWQNVQSCVLTGPSTE
jgi:hypothetical protein